MKETELAKVMVEYLDEMGWDVYQEVRIHDRGGIADIVAIMDKKVWVLECKTTLSLAVMAQADSWIPWANWVSVVVPDSKQRYGRTNKARNFAEKVLRELGIGLITIGFKSFSCYSIEPVFRRKALTKYFLNTVTIHHKTFARAGNSDGRYFSPWRNTCMNVVRYVTQHDGALLKDVIESVQHHYYNNTSARVAMAKWIREGKVEGLKIRKQGGYLRVFLAQD